MCISLRDISAVHSTERQSVLLKLEGVIRGLLFGWVEVFRSGFKEHTDLLTLGDVHRQLNQSLHRRQKHRKFRKFINQNQMLLLY